MKQDWKPGTMVYPLPAVMVITLPVEQVVRSMSMNLTWSMTTTPPPLTNNVND